MEQVHAGADRERCEARIAAQKRGLSEMARSQRTRERALRRRTSRHVRA
jgi:hypothetical protein